MSELMTYCKSLTLSAMVPIYMDLYSATESHCEPRLIIGKVEICPNCCTYVFGIGFHLDGHLIQFELPNELSRLQCSDKLVQFTSPRLKTFVRAQRELSRLALSCFEMP